MKSGVQGRVPVCVCFFFCFEERFSRLRNISEGYSVDRHNAHEFNHENVSGPTLSVEFKGISLVFRRYATTNPTDSVRRTAAQKTAPAPSFKPFSLDQYL